MASHSRRSGIVTAAAVVCAMVSGAGARDLNEEDLELLVGKIDAVSTQVGDTNQYVTVVMALVIFALLILLWMFHSEVKRLKRIEDDVEEGLTRKNSLNHKKSMANSALYSRREKAETDNIERLPTMSRVPGGQ